MAAFGRSVKAFGVLLTSQQVLNQYERYNRSRDLDRETQALLGSILDSIEAAEEVESDTP